MSVENPQVDRLLEVLRELRELKKGIAELTNNPPVASDWLPRSRVMEFFHYGDTQMAALEKNEGLVVARIGNRKFFHRDSIVKIIEQNIVQA
jgi:hypothetical protein